MSTGCCHKTSTMYRINYNISVALLFTFLFINTEIIGADPSSQCGEVRQSYRSMGFSDLDVPVHAIALKADDLEICPAGFSCCTRDMEIQLTTHSQLIYDQRLGNATEPAKRKLVAATTELHAFFTQQIAKAQKDADAMFTTAYNIQYTQNKEVFDELFSNFQKFYSGQNLNISQVVHQFFRDVFVKMFDLQHPAYNFSAEYLICVGDKMDTIKPFGTVPEVLQRNLKQALVASRTLIQGLAVGRNVAITTQKVSPTMSCTKAHMKMNFCSHCQGLPSLKPCANYCLNVIKGCLSYHSELDKTWQRFIDAMDALSIRVAGDGSFNLESVLNPLKDEISVAIMENHGNREEILLKVLDSKTGCGQPASAPTRPKRQTFSRGRSSPIRSRTSVRLRTLVEGIRSTLRDVKYLWTHTSLAGTMCSAISATTGQRCWNGESEAIYRKPLVGNGLLANKDNPEVTVDPTRPNSDIVDQIKQLQEITSMIINATIGAGTVNWVDLQIPLLPNVSASTSGEGRSVKMDGSHVSIIAEYRLDNFLRDTGTGSGSGYGKGLDDDEDLIKYSGGGLKWHSKLPLIPKGEHGSGSGDLFKHVNPDEEQTIEIEEQTTPAVIQPGVGATEQIIRAKPSTTKAPAQATTSSCNTVSSTFSITMLSIVFITLVSS